MANLTLGPDAESIILSLFRYFMAYTNARSSAERLALESQILSLFESLGAAEHSTILAAHHI